MASNLDTLKTTQSGIDSYTPLTEAQIANTAQDTMQGVYDQKRGDSQSAYNQTDAALEQQLIAQMDSYAKMQGLSSQNYAQAATRIEQQIQSRGVQRGNYNNALRGYMGRLGDEASQKIQAARAIQEGNVNEQRKLLAQQLSQQMAQYDQSQQTDTRAYADSLRDREYDRGVTAEDAERKLAMQLYAFEHQLEQEAEDKRRWEEEMTLKRAALAASRRSGRGGGSGKASASSAGDGSYGEFMSTLGAQTVTLRVGSKASNAAVGKMDDKRFAAFQKELSSVKPSKKIQLGFGPIK